MRMRARTVVLFSKAHSELATRVLRRGTLAHYALLFKAVAQLVRGVVLRPQGYCERFGHSATVLEVPGQQKLATAD
jgi:hypothetical protein